ncbi:UDP-glucose--hexose-1-phosphate uridylyltransferase [Aquimarina sp. 2201CG5-10]|uniref:UDP-glucose--hexose-1-phosphate uridylyltransferase n=1 Tax=Aquimarina callyspongiae TaxID=3098150 RepID=UPI002AB5B58E|nr:UDP-glucose--hexose-1-phosphate uridylyltransferase [Aquimarina sp. 2201CG5-10]MDY8137971.1 UDP-glucose--hexose-1-phosphate uridylyltransferase [Aquimarina sp. 2201CG5-10]
MNSTIYKHSHIRKNILTGESILVSPHRTNRPWQGKTEDIILEKRPNYDKNCYLCPTNTRANGEKNPDYQDVFSFTNDFAALQEDIKTSTIDNELFQAYSERGICKVVCYSPDHSKSLADLSIAEIEKVVQLWIKEYNELGNQDLINYVQIFENKGAIMGCSNPHPHGQIWSQSTIPNEIVKKSHNQLVYFQKKQSYLLQDYTEQELIKKERVVYENECFVVLVPFWAVWPFETMIIPKKHQPDISNLNDQEQYYFSEAISVITKTYDTIFSCSFPYSSGIHQAPTNKKSNDHWHWHMSFYPPLLRSATIKKFMVGYEMFGMPQRDITPESSAEIIRNNLIQNTSGK